MCLKSNTSLSTHFWLLWRYTRLVKLANLRCFIISQWHFISGGKEILGGTKIECADCVCVCVGGGGGGAQMMEEEIEEGVDGIYRKEMLTLCWVNLSPSSSLRIFISNSKRRGIWTPPPLSVPFLSVCLSLSLFLSLSLTSDPIIDFSPPPPRRG